MVYWEKKTCSQREALMRSIHSWVGGGADEGGSLHRGFSGKDVT